MWAIAIAILLTAGQDPKAPAPGRKIPTPLTPKPVEVAIVTEGSRFVRLDLKTRKLVREVSWSNDVIKVHGEASKWGAVFDALEPGVSRVTITDKDGTKEEVFVVVEKGEPMNDAPTGNVRTSRSLDRFPAVAVPEGNFVQLEIKTKKNITEVYCSNGRVIKPYTGSGRDLLFETLKPGLCHIVMKDTDGTRDKVLVVVEKKQDEKGAKKK